MRYFLIPYLALCWAAPLFSQLIDYNTQLKNQPIIQATPGVNTLTLAIQKTPTGGILMLPSGVYTLTSTAAIAKTITVICQPGANILAGAGSIALLGVGAANVTVEGCTFNSNNNVNTSGIGVTATATNFTANNNTYTDSTHTMVGNNLSSSGVGVHLFGNVFNGTMTGDLVLNDDAVLIDGEHCTGTKDCVFAGASLGVFTNGATITVHNLVVNANVNYTFEAAIEWLGNGNRWIDFQGFSLTAGAGIIADMISGGTDSFGIGTVTTSGSNGVTVTATGLNSGVTFCVALKPGQLVTIGKITDTVRTINSCSVITLNNGVGVQTNAAMNWDQLVGGVISNNSAVLTAAATVAPGFACIEAYGHDYTISNNKCSGVWQAGILYDGWNNKILYNTLIGMGETSGGGDGIGPNNGGNQNPAYNNLIDSNTIVNTQTGGIEGDNGSIITNNTLLKNPGYWPGDFTGLAWFAILYETNNLATAGLGLINTNNITILPPMNGFTTPSTLGIGCFWNLNLTTAAATPSIWRDNSCLNQSGTQGYDGWYAATASTNFAQTQMLHNVYTNLANITEHIGFGGGLNSRSGVSFAGNFSLAGDTDFTIGTTSPYIDGTNSTTCTPGSGIGSGGACTATYSVQGDIIRGRVVINVGSGVSANALAVAITMPVTLLGYPLFRSNSMGCVFSSDINSLGPVDGLIGFNPDTSTTTSLQFYSTSTPLSGNRGMEFVCPRN